MINDITTIDYQVKDYRFKLGDKIKLIREQKGYSQKQLAELMDINRTTISKIENGKFSITIDYLVRFSIFLDYEFKVIEKEKLIYGNIY
ncbi:helix-turn-helix domain-containing protein [Flavobacterium degerlachei]|uniref:Helix-turn-helix n=1 Tax=Flavobacterium degerlachei TaxID=229203 RepID=A0A1H3GMR6_9FLAO|nr:helix-turn-helix transcriptional regulator [Flavobacterium degerlachei]SDY03804.1 Helix-turn-helix [Flavobacterium degerlachei]